MLVRTRLLILSLAAASAPDVARAEGEGAPGAAMAASPPAAAEPDVADARDAFRLGSSLARQGQWADALAAFQRSSRLKPHPATTYNVAYSERALGRYVRAALHFREALAAPASADAPALPPELAGEASSYLAEAERRVVRVTVRPGASNLTLRVDGKAIEPIPDWDGRAPHMLAETDDAPAGATPPEFELWLDPGSHVFVASRADGTQSVVNRTLAAGEAARIDFPPLTASSANANADATDAPPPARPPRVDLALPVAARDRTAAYVAFGIGAAGLVASGVFTGLALADKQSLEDDAHCTRRLCPDEPWYRDRQDRMWTFADLATAGFVVGVAGAGIGTALLLWPAPGQPGTGTVPMVRRSAAGLRLRF